MKNKVSLLFLFIICSCLCVFAQQTSIIHQNVSTETGANTQIQQLQAADKKMDEQMQKLEKDIELYREDFRQKSSEINDNMSHWLTVLSGILAIIGVGLGVVSPILINRGYEEQLRGRLKTEFETQLKSVSQQAQKAEKAVKTLKEQLRISENLKAKADEAAREAKTSLLFFEAHAEQDLSRKKELYSKAIKLNPDFAQSYMNRGAVEYELGEREEAIKDYGKAIEKKPDYAEAFNNRGIARSESSDIRDINEAITDYNEAIKLKPNYAEAYINRGDAKDRRGDSKGAIIDYDTAIRLKPNHAGAYINRGILKSKSGDFDGAIKDYREAIKLKPDNAEAYMNRGDANNKLGKLKEAIKDYCMVIKLKPNHAGAYSNRAEVYKKMAEEETDKSKAERYLANSNADEKTAKSLEYYPS